MMDEPTDAYEEVKKRLPLGMSSFEELRSNSMTYVDKTSFIGKLAEKRKKFFLSRPRRFGKSLLISTFESLFRYGLRDFQGLDITGSWRDEGQYKVVHLDFSEIKAYADADEFQQQLEGFLEEGFSEHGFAYDPGNRSAFMFQLSRWMKRQASGSFVLLIDEYDAPLTVALLDPVLFRNVRRMLSQFYSRIKSNDRLWRFVFMTGITKFNQTGIFSELNQFSDISLQEEFSTLLGYTPEEVRRYFGDCLEHAARLWSITTDELLERLVEQYDGYCFDGLDGLPREPRHVFTPWSILSFFSNPEAGLKNYWIESGGRLQLLEQFFRDRPFGDPKNYVREKELPYEELTASSNVDEINEAALLTQAGYLTIRRRSGPMLYVSYPNREVALSMADLYARRLLSGRPVASVSSGLVDALRAGRIDDAMKEINKAFLAINSMRHPVQNESVCQGFALLLLRGAGFYVIVERQNAFGRSDLEFDAGRMHWVIELKFLHSSGNERSVRKCLAAALGQIRRNRYGEDEGNGRKLVRVAAVFSEDARQFVCWQAADGEDGLPASAEDIGKTGSGRLQ